MICRISRLVSLLCLLAGTGWLAPVAAQTSTSSTPLALEPGDRVALMGNTLAERMQYHGWLEALLQSRFPEHRLVVRNLGFSGDELTLRLRSKDFGTPDQWLSRVQATVVFAMFGYNESFAGRDGLEDFRRDLAAFIEHTRQQRYDGSHTPRLVLFSPTAHEDLQNPNLPDGRENNARLEMYTEAMRDVAAQEGVPFVDLLHASQQLYAQHDEPLTINGIHLTEKGNQLLAEVIDQALFGSASPASANPARLEAVRQAVLQKNFYWFNRYRTTDGYSIYGGRADLQFVDGQTNRVVMQREMEVLDVMTANRDPLIWAAAEGQSYQVDDSNTPPFIPVKTNKPGPLPGGKHVFKGGEEAIEAMTVAQGMKVNLYASEEMFPELVNPVQMAWDTRGRLWVAAWENYPHWRPDERMNDKLLILEDTDQDGVADVCKTFADKLTNPTGFEFWGNGVLLAQAPNLVYLRDTDGDDRADVEEIVLHGIDSADTHHTANSFVLSQEGALYFQEGTFHHTQVETPWKAPVRSANAAVYRFEPRTSKLDVFVPFGFANPHGHVVDRWGMHIVHDGTGAVPYDASLFSGHLDFPAKHPQPPTLYQQRTRPCPATEILSSRHFPEANQGNLLVGNVIGFQGILQYRLEEDGASYRAIEVEPIVSSSDPNFRPVDIEIGSDGAIYFTDWQNPIIGHMQHNLRDPSRDRTHGRVYRVTYTGRPLLEDPPIAGAPIDDLIPLLSWPEDRVRYRVRIELSGRPSDEVLAAAQAWLAQLDPESPEYPHQQLEVLWLHQSHNVVNVELLDQVLASPEHRARAAATRVLCYWRDRVPGTLDRLRKLAADPHPRVRLEAVRAASFLEEPEAMEVPVIAAALQRDRYLDYVIQETQRALEPIWKEALDEEREIAFTTSAGRAFYLSQVSTTALLKMEPSRDVFEELLFRPGLQDDQRQQALARLAQLEGSSEMAVLVEAFRTLDERQEPGSVIYDLVRLLTGRPPGQLGELRGAFEQLATDARQSIVRQVGYVALMTADGQVEPAWKLAAGSIGRLHDLLQAVSMIPDASLRVDLYPRIEPLLRELPAELADDVPAGSGDGRYVRIALPRRGTLTLAEVEVYSGERNVARQGKASQKNTAFGGDPDRAIDGRTSGQYGRGGQTHTEENTPNPWWEVDLGDAYPIDRIVVYNRTDGDFGRRLEGFTLQVLNGQRQVVFERVGVPAPRRRATIPVEGGGPKGQIRRAAMVALTNIPGQEARTFALLAGFVRRNEDRVAALGALQRIPSRYWPEDQVKPLLDAILAYLGGLSPEERTATAARDALQLGYSLAARLPGDTGRSAVERLGELGVRTIRVGTIPHRMAFDVERLAVKAGAPVEIIFENSDIMPHNLVITEPGAMEEIGLLAESTAQDPRSAARDYVPQSPRILLASRLLQTNQSQRLTFTAPRQPGIYPFVCTYPGHWRRMYGALYVVADLNQYQADPEAYLAANPLEIRDELLKFNRPRTEWTLEDLAPGADNMVGRDFSTGREMFQVATCVTCHKFDGQGNEFGPDLTKLDPPRTLPEMLGDILEPSARINEHYQTYVFQLASGKIVSGLVVDEDDQQVRVVVDPLTSTEPMVIAKEEIEERVKSPTSMMPKGLLDKLTREEILDLIAYVYSKADPQHAYFRGGHQHHE